MRHSRFISSTPLIAGLDAMNRNFTSILALILVCLVFGFLTGCSSSGVRVRRLAASASHHRDHGDERIGTNRKRR